MEIIEKLEPWREALLEQRGKEAHSEGKVQEGMGSRRRTSKGKNGRKRISGRMIRDAVLTCAQKLARYSLVTALLYSLYCMTCQ